MTFLPRVWLQPHGPWIGAPFPHPVAGGPTWMRLAFSSPLSRAFSSAKVSPSHFICKQHAWYMLKSRGWRTDLDFRWLASRILWESACKVLTILLAVGQLGWHVMAGFWLPNVDFTLVTLGTSAFRMVCKRKQSVSIQVLG